jgi:hypothetical protein
LSADVELDDAEDEVTGIEGNGGAITADLWDPDDENGEAELEKELIEAEESLENFKFISDEDTSRKIDELYISLEGGEDEKFELKEAIRKLSLSFLRLKTTVFKIKYKGDVNEGIGDAFKNMKKKIKSSTNKFMSKFDLPGNLLEDLKIMSEKDAENAKDFKSDVIETIAALKQTGAKFDLGIDTFLWVLYAHHGNIEETADTMKWRAKDRREQDLNADAYYGGYSIDESNKTSKLQESLKPIIEKMLKEHYNH